MRLILPILFLILGTAGGVGAAMFLVPPPDDEALHADAMVDETGPCGPGEAIAQEPAPADPPLSEGREYVRLNNQFVVPVVSESRVEALVVMALSLEVVAGAQQNVFSLEPKLRDGFLQVMFDHANLGGFEGVFTASTNMRSLRAALLQTARDIVGPSVTDVLIFDLVRQDS